MAVWGRVHLLGSYTHSCASLSGTCFCFCSYHCLYHCSCSFIGCSNNSQCHCLYICHFLSLCLCLLWKYLLYYFSCFYIRHHAMLLALVKITLMVVLNVFYYMLLWNCYIHEMLLCVLLVLTYGHAPPGYLQVGDWSLTWLAKYMQCIYTNIHWGRCTWIWVYGILSSHLTVEPGKPEPIAIALICNIERIMSGLVLKFFSWFS